VVLKVMMMNFICGMLKYFLTKWATALSILVIIVYFSVTPRDAGEREHYGGISSPILSKGNQRLQN